MSDIKYTVAWLRAAQEVRHLCTNSNEFDALIESIKLRFVYQMLGYDPDIKRLT